MRLQSSKIMMAFVLSGSALLLPACRDQDLALGAGLAIGVIVGSSASDHQHGDYYDRSPPPRYRERRDRNWSEISATVGDPQMTEVQDFAANYDISETAAEKVLVSLDETQKGNMVALQDIGMEKTDLVALMNDQELTDKTLTKVSDKLEMSTDATISLIQKIKIKMRAALKQRRPATPSYIPGH